ncbi:MAG: hypothetical protein Q9220_006936 [cf. Caloplaca sp. 1 TL-2023]
MERLEQHGKTLRLVLPPHSPFPPIPETKTNLPPSHSGASYTSTGFNWLPPSTLPSPGNPLGNHVRGPTSSNGPNFITYLTTTFNASLLQTYNFAFPGASVSQAAMNPGTTFQPGHTNDMDQQVNNGFLPSYTAQSGHAPYTTWTGDTSLFVSFFGINDLLQTYTRPNFQQVAAAIFEQYANNLATLYSAGARNFLLLNCPPMDLSPDFTGNENIRADQAGLTHSDPASRAAIKAAVEIWNAQFAPLQQNFLSSHPDATVFVYDTFTLFNNLQTQPDETLAGAESEYGLQKPITNLTSSCQWYDSLVGHPVLGGGGEGDFEDERCGGGVGGYFWLNGIHVTWSVHRILAGGVARGLWGGR